LTGAIRLLLLLLLLLTPGTYLLNATPVRCHTCMMTAETVSLVHFRAPALRGLIRISGGASAVKEPGHFGVRKSSSQVTRMHFFPQKS